MEMTKAIRKGGLKRWVYCADKYRRGSDKRSGGQCSISKVFALPLLTAAIAPFRARAAIYNEQLGLPAALDEGHRARRA
jgi:hypothetical protein